MAQSAARGSHNPKVVSSSLTGRMFFCNEVLRKTRSAQLIGSFLLPDAFAAADAAVAAAVVAWGRIRSECLFLGVGFLGVLGGAQNAQKRKIPPERLNPE